MIENRMLVDSEWESIDSQWVEPEEIEFRKKKPKRKLRLRRIFNEEERNEHGENNIVSADR